MNHANGLLTTWQQQIPVPLTSNASFHHHTGHAILYPRKARDMSADFWAGYASGAVGILIGNPLDVRKVTLQAVGQNASIASLTPTTSRGGRIMALARGEAMLRL